MTATRTRALDHLPRKVHTNHPKSCIKQRLADESRPAPRIEHIASLREIRILNQAANRRGVGLHGRAFKSGGLRVKGFR